VAELYTQGLRVEDIVKRLNVSTSTVARVIADNDLEKRFKRHLLLPEQEIELVCRYKSGENYAELEEAYSVSSTVIQSALRKYGVRPRTGWSKYRTVCWTDRKGRNFIFKSTWELAYARRLDARLEEWDYEIISYPLVRCRCYTPDFMIHGSDGDRLVEIHGWLDEPTECKLCEFVETYPSLRLEVLGPAELVEMGLIDSNFAKHPMARKVSRLRDTLLRISENKALGRTDP
jgi:hypothetical protein